MADEAKVAEAVARKDAGNKAYAEKDYDEAIRLYTEAIALDPAGHVYFSNRAAVHFAKGDHALAVEDARECLKRKPDFVKGYYRLALAQIEMGELDEAEKTLRGGLQVDGKSADLNRQLRLVRAKKASKARRTTGQGKSRAARAAAAGGGQGPAMDEATAQELSELGEQYQQTQREVSMVQRKQRMCAVDLRKIDVTRKQVNELPSEVNIMKGIGKMFKKSTKTEILADLQRGQEKGEAMSTELDTKMKYLTRRLQNQEMNLKEIMANAQAGA